MPSIRKFICALAITICGTYLAEHADADVIYQFESLSGDILGEMTFAEPPASGTTGWTSNNPGDLLSLFLDDATFGLGSGNVLDFFINFLVFDFASLGGTELDFSLGIQDDTPGGGAGGVSDFIQLSFGTSLNVDIVESFANAAFIPGHWSLMAAAPMPVPEPGTLALFCIGLAGMGLMRRRRKSTASESYS